ncbi:MAG: DHH family phosphoesterase [Candidatus Nanoarchaeia archaeon]
MLTKKQIKEIKEHLEKAQNPLFFFDSDPDGLCAFLLLQRFIGRGKGAIMKSSFESVSIYLSKIHELNADYIFLLDTAVVHKAFFEEVRKINIPVVWIDHHLIEKSQIPSFVNYYNPRFNKEKGFEPTTCLCYQVSQKKEDLWIALVGCLSDKFVPEFYSDFCRIYPDLVLSSKKKNLDAFDIIYGAPIGRISQMFNAGLKDTTTNVVKMLKFLMKVKSPYEVLEGSDKNARMIERFEDIDKKQKKLVKRATNNVKLGDAFIIFKYEGETSLTGELANELSYKFPDKTILVIYIKGPKANISMRGKDALKIILKAIHGLKDARGGGHDKAVGGQIKAEDINKFTKRVKDLLDK